MAAATMMVTSIIEHLKTPFQKHKGPKVLELSITSKVLSREIKVTWKLIFQRLSDDLSFHMYGHEAIMTFHYCCKVIIQIAKVSNLFHGSK